MKWVGIGQIELRRYFFLIFVFCFFFLENMFKQEAKNGTWKNLKGGQVEK
jgi:hypothetical protein